MKFIKEHINDIVRLMLNQFALAVFGIVLVSASRMANKGVYGGLALGFGIFSILFYMYILYATLQEMGSKHRVRIESGRMTRDPLYGLKLMTLAQVPTLLVLLFLFISYPFSFVLEVNFFKFVFLVFNYVIYFIQAMYSGVIGFILSKCNLLDATTGELTTSTGALVHIICYFVSVIPGILVCWVSYLMGLRDIKIASVFRRRPPEEKS